MPRQVNKIFLGIGLLAAAGGASLLRPGSAPGDLMPAPLAGGTPVPELSQTYGPQPGYRYVYQFTRQIDFTGDFAGATFPRLAYHGEFYVDVVRADGHAFQALVSEKLAEVGDRVSPALRLDASRAGDQLALYTDPNLRGEEAEHVAVVKDLVALWLFPLRQDTVGPYRASFAREGDARAQKAKLAYTLPGANVPTILESRHLLEWNLPEQVPQRVRGAENTRLGAGATALQARSAYSLEFRGRERSPLPASLLAALSQREPLTLAATALAQHPEYARLDWNKIRGDLSNLDALSNSARLAVFGDLLRYLRLHPEKIGEVAALLEDPAVLGRGSDSPLFKTLVGALANVGGPVAFRALRDSYGSTDLANSGRGTILAALTTSPVPVDADTRAFLAERMRGERDPRLAEGAAFALGSALQNSGNDPQSQAAVQQIQDSWSAAQAPGAQLALLDVMGNSGRPEFFGTLSQVAASGPSDALRARATFALRFEASASTDLLARLSDRAPAVRQAAAEAIALADWTELYRNPLTACAGRDPVSGVQNACRQALTSHPQVASNP